MNENCTNDANNSIATCPADDGQTNFSLEFKKRSDRNRSKARVNIGAAFHHWRQLLVTIIGSSLGSCLPPHCEEVKMGEKATNKCC
uniref:Uncharacterized protein n=1 Tax=Lates calcarifer TaxID=8187 RepID=A0A4W6D989_LATCA